MWRNRVEAGRALAVPLKKYAGSDAIVLGVPRGGVILAREVARELGLPLDIVISRKMGAPGNPELGIGAVSSDGKAVVDQKLAKLVGADEAYILSEKKRQIAEMRRRETAFRGGNPRPKLKGRTAIIVDDGIATGVTTEAATAYLKRLGATVVVAVPVAPPDTVEKLRLVADEVIVLETPVLFGAVGAFYEDFRQVEDDEVKKALI